ncbi:hypothetical protein HMPREF1250_0652 [Megasphaera vaginalis (ex Srinivasan et al. 2021)]|uniref:Uncharacterized protein n=1 Tax=Megasphaera vaginalis (ex Srinivasan et al. 2021) TaxID=1111454 RepID=U7UGN2_9FIRM|nr:hypothetical protein HMPREF1250_0652 [Megasphaera vaginalis (ex Srinivasan et al. 2021)]
MYLLFLYVNLIVQAEIKTLFHRPVISLKMRNKIVMAVVSKGNVNWRT